MSIAPARILAIDDDDAILSLLADALSPPHQVATAQEWLEGVDLLMNQQFDLLIIDLGMPVFDSVEFIHKIRAQPPYDRIPILVISAYPKLRERLGDFQVQAILSKPFSVQSLTHTVMSLLSDGATHTALPETTPPESHESRSGSTLRPASFPRHVQPAARDHIVQRPHDQQPQPQQSRPDDEPR